MWRWRSRSQPYGQPGPRVMNRNLSQARADAVLDALAARRVLTGAISAVGYGEEQPIETNETEEGRGQSSDRVPPDLALSEGGDRHARRADRRRGHSRTDGDGASGETTGAPPTDPTESQYPSGSDAGDGWCSECRSAPPQPAPERPEGSLRPPGRRDNRVGWRIGSCGSRGRRRNLEGEVQRSPLRKRRPKKLRPTQSTCA